MTRALYILLGAVLLVLLIACANIANLLFANGAGRKSEIAVRKALGADSARVARQLIVETSILCVAGCALGLLLSTWSLRVATSALAASVPRIEEVKLDSGVMLFACLLLALCALLCGLAPALTLARTNLADSMKGARGSAGSRAAASRRALLIAVQVGLSVVLLVGTGLLLRSFLQLTSVRLGFDAARVEKFSVSLPRARYVEFEDRIQFIDRMRAALAAIPGVEIAAAVTGAPLSGNGFGSSFELLDRPLPAPGEEPSTSVRIATPDYFSTVSIPIVAGRAIDASDGTSAPGVVVVSKKTAEWLWPGQNPIGKQLRLHASMGMPESRIRTVIGVAADVRSSSLEEVSEREMYIPYAQAAASSVTFLVRSRSGMTSVLPQAKAELKRLDADLPMRGAGPLSIYINRQLAQPRLYATLLTAFAGLAIALAAIGLYGLVAFQVSQRRREIGIRMAIGATAGRLVGHVMTTGLRPAIIGTTAGLVAAFAATRLIRSMLYGIEALDVLTWISVPVGVLALSAIVTLLPARRAARVQPVEVLHAD